MGRPSGLAHPEKFPSYAIENNDFTVSKLCRILTHRDHVQIHLDNQHGDESQTLVTHLCTHILVVTTVNIRLSNKIAFIRFAVVVLTCIH